MWVRYPDRYSGYRADSLMVFYSDERPAFRATALSTRVYKDKGGRRTGCDRGDYTRRRDHVSDRVRSSNGLGR
jgi:hypothetical protein